MYVLDSIKLGFLKILIIDVTNIRLDWWLCMWDLNLGFRVLGLECRFSSSVWSLDLNLKLYF